LSLYFLFSSIKNLHTAHNVHNLCAASSSCVRYCARCADLALVLRDDADADTGARTLHTIAVLASHFEVVTPCSGTTQACSSRAKRHHLPPFQASFSNN
jgi:hypothetical protein